MMVPLSSRARSLWRNLFRRAVVERELDDELRAHLELVIAARLAEGLDPAQARRQALMDVGGVEQIKEAVRERRAGQRLETVARDLRHGLRSLRRSPGYTVTVVLSLALGIGANAAIFSLVEAVFLRSLPVPDPQALVFFSDQDGPRGSGPVAAMRLPALPYPLYQDLVSRNRAEALFSGLAAQQSGHTISVVRRLGVDEEPIAGAAGQAVTANYFEVFGVGAARGRTFTAEDQAAPGLRAVVVLSDRFWRRRFAGDPTVLGSRLAINGTSYTVIGIAPPPFIGSTPGNPVDFWVPLTMQEQLMRPKSEGRTSALWLDQPGQWWLVVFGRLRPAGSLATAEASVARTLQRYLAAHPELLGGGVEPQSVRIALEWGARGMAPLRSALRAPLTVLMVAVGLLLVVVCLNVSHLVLARAIRREREMSIRSALGATRGRLLGQLLGEGALLAAAGAALALVIVPWLSAGLLAFDPDRNDLALDLGRTLPVAGFTAALALATAILLGLVPAWRAGRGSLARALRTTAAALTADRSRRPASRILLVSQIAFSLVLLASAGLLAGTLARLRSADKGFEDEHLLVVRIDPRLGRLGEDGARRLPRALSARLSTLPGVYSASLSTYGLLSGASWTRSLSRSAATPRGEQVPMNTNGVTARYFDTVGMRLLRGPGFTAEGSETTPAVVVLNEAAARRLFGTVNVVGSRLHEHGRIPRDMEVVGVVRDARTQGLGRAPPPMYYVPVGQQDDFAGSVEIRTAGDPALLAPRVLRLVHREFPEVAVLDVRTMGAQVERTLTGERILATLAAAFALFALVLVSLGLHGVISQWASQRTHEIGVRMSLGTTVGSVRWLVLRQAFALVLIGLALGLPATLASSRLLRGLLSGLRPIDPGTLLASALALLAVATSAAYLPARRASRVDPAAALRCE
jgi:predicted permease